MSTLSQVKENKWASNALKTAAKIPKPVYYLGGAILGYYLLVKPIAKGLGKTFNPDPANDEFQEGTKEVVGRPTNDGSTRGSLSQNEIDSIAQIQLNAMDRPGTSEDRLFDSLKNLSGKDLQRVYTSFGKKWYDPILGVRGGAVFAWAGNSEQDLFSWYDHELDDKQLAQMRQIWSKSGLFFGNQSNPLG